MDVEFRPKPLFLDTRAIVVVELAVAKVREHKGRRLVDLVLFGSGSVFGSQCRTEYLQERDALGRRPSLFSCCRAGQSLL